MYNLTEYNDNCSDISVSLWQFKRDKQNLNNGNPANVTTDDSSSFRYGSSFFKPLTAADNGVFKGVKISVLLKNVSNFLISLEMSLINCKVHPKLNWTEDV